MKNLFVVAAICCFVPGAFAQSGTTLGPVAKSKDDSCPTRIEAPQAAIPGAWIKRKQANGSVHTLVVKGVSSDRIAVEFSGFPRKYDLSWGTAEFLEQGDVVQYRDPLRMLMFPAVPGQTHWDQTTQRCAVGRCTEVKWAGKIDAIEKIELGGQHYCAIKVSVRSGNGSGFFWHVPGLPWFVRAETQGLPAPSFDTVEWFVPR